MADFRDFIVAPARSGGSRIHRGLMLGPTIAPGGGIPRKDPGDDHVVKGGDGDPGDPPAIHAAFNNMLQKAGLPPVPQNAGYPPPDFVRELQQASQPQGFVGPRNTETPIGSAHETRRLANVTVYFSAATSGRSAGVGADPTLALGYRPVFGPGTRTTAEGSPPVFADIRPPVPPRVPRHDELKDGPCRPQSQALSLKEQFLGPAGMAESLISDIGSPQSQADFEEAQIALKKLIKREPHLVCPVIFSFADTDNALIREVLFPPPEYPRTNFGRLYLSDICTGLLGAWEVISWVEDYLTFLDPYCKRAWEEFVSTLVGHGSAIAAWLEDWSGRLFEDLGADAYSNPYWRKINEARDLLKKDDPPSEANAERAMKLLREVYMDLRGDV